MEQGLLIPRYITGVAGFATVGTLPVGITKTGTFSSVGTIVTGVGSKFTTELVGGDWLYSSTSKELREVGWISKYDTGLTLKTSAFTAPAAGDNVVVCKTRYTGVMITVSGAANVTINGSTYKPGEVISYTDSDGIDPIYYDATGSEITFDVSY